MNTFFIATSPVDGHKIGFNLADVLLVTTEKPDVVEFREEIPVELSDHGTVVLRLVPEKSLIVTLDDAERLLSVLSK
jgi:hypothetical protein